MRGRLSFPSRRGGTVVCQYREDGVLIECYPSVSKTGAGRREAKQCRIWEHVVTVNHATRGKGAEGDGVRGDDDRRDSSLLLCFLRVSELDQTPYGATHPSCLCA